MSMDATAIIDRLIARLAGGSLVVTGASGFLGSHLSRRLEQVPGVVAVTRGPFFFNCGQAVQIDLADRHTTWALLEAQRPAVVLHAAAETNVDRCESNPPAAVSANVDATAHIAHWICEHSPATLLVYISTDQVYDGTGPHDIVPVWPRNVYAMTKYSGESIARSCPHHLVVRTNFVGWSPRGNGFVNWLATSLQQGKPIMLADDVIFNPLAAGDLALLLLDIIGRGIEATLNLGASGPPCSKSDFGLTLGRLLGLNVSMVTIGKMNDLQLLARRPMDMSMDVRAVADVLGYPLPSVTDTLNRLAAEFSARQTANKD